MSVATAAILSTKLRGDVFAEKVNSRVIENCYLLPMSRSLLPSVRRSNAGLSHFKVRL